MSIRQDNMEIKILDDKKNRLIMEAKGVDHTLCNPLKRELWNDKHIKIASYSIRHPQISVPQIIIETDGDETPRNAIAAAVGRIKKDNAKFKKEFLNEL